MKRVFIKRIALVLLLVISILFLFLCIKKQVNKPSEIPHRLQWWLEAINWDAESRENGLSGDGILIAVIDTAIDIEHPDLVGKNIEQIVVDDVNDINSFEHGTAVAGILCAYPKTNEGVLGIATNANILSIVISSNTEADIESLIRGIEYAISKKADIINISAGVITEFPALQNVINDAFDAGIIIVAASGNDLAGGSLYPAKYDNVISVGSFDFNGQPLYGSDSNSVLLPGGNIVTTYSSIYEPKKYVSFSGTSMSCAMLSGVIALILEQNPNISNVDVLNYFRYNSQERFDTLSILDDFRKMSK